MMYMGYLPARTDGIYEYSLGRIIEDKKQTFFSSRGLGKSM